MVSSNPIGIPLLICSIGNPTATYAKTLHSAGHVAVQALRLHQNQFKAQNFSPWKPHLSGQISTPEDVRKFNWKGFEMAPSDSDRTLWMSGSLMNISGPAVKKVWQWWRASTETRNAKGRLIIVHDELEKEIGQYLVKTNPKSSAKGHNGIKSIQSSLPNIPFIRIGIGIGRPVSRDADTIIKHVLRRMTQRELDGVERAGQAINSPIRDIQDGYSS
ncbi:peptidyl-tRNA hydrolase [Tothia fuscella]|uniref:peptidyl-tRNA hydrolase n=1 Tax=Tothia fuscella TaxID=1048955 RepID=A0A9P4P147_9PEZI|nr:peptidyl-tRNA hydrolase [Tothia fuscella]